MFKYFYNLAMLAAESQQVIGLRLMKIAAGGPAAVAEAQLMMSEKMITGTVEAGRLMTGASTHSVVTSYRRKVRANRRRLSR